ncbi:hypothetical protein [Streptomyces sp. NPDC029003]|uniref:hypothetical protein n=1 Tax=Streptomyces sp. NPDC029003 TaxID=3155125 RepID=UPI003400B8D8
MSSFDPGELPGVYRNDATGGEVVLGPDGVFSATGLSTDGHSGPADFSGGWEFVNSDSSSDFVYLTVKGDGLGQIGGIQLYPTGRGTLEVRTPDKPPSLVLKRVATP